MVIQRRLPTKLEEDLQREYTRQVLSQRGYLPGNPNAMVPVETDIDFEPTEVIEGEEGSVVRVNASFPVAPIAAYVDGKYPLHLHVTLTAANRAEVAFSVPAGTGRHSGPVTLVFPDGTFLLDSTLHIRRRSVVEPIEFQRDEGKQGQMYLIMDFPEEPMEVHIGTRELAPEDYVWRNGHLTIQVPKDCPSGPVLMLTSRRVYRSPVPYEAPADAKIPAKANEKA